MDPDVRGGRELSQHSELGQLDGVVTGRGELVAVRKGCGLALPEHRQVHRLERRHHEEMAAVGRPGPIQPGVAEAEDLLVAVIVTGRIGRPLMELDRDGFRAQTHHAEGDHRPGEVIPAHPRKPPGANERIDPPPQIEGLRLRLQLAGPRTNNPLVLKDERPDKSGEPEQQD